MSDRERYNRYLCSREWAVLRRKVLARADGVCERCHDNPATQVHHKTYARKYRELLDDLQAICEPCHQFTHGLTDVDPQIEAHKRLDRQVNQDKQQEAYRKARRRRHLQQLRKSKDPADRLLLRLEDKRLTEAEEIEILQSVFNLSKERQASRIAGYACP